MGKLRKINQKLSKYANVQISRQEWEGIKHQFLHSTPEQEILKAVIQHNLNEFQKEVDSILSKKEQATTQKFAVLDERIGHLITESKLSTSKYGKKYTSIFSKYCDSLSTNFNDDQKEQDAVDIAGDHHGDLDG